MFCSKSTDGISPGLSVTDKRSESKHEFIVRRLEFVRIYPAVSVYKCDVTDVTFIRLKRLHYV